MEPRQRLGLVALFVGLVLGLPLRAADLTTANGNRLPQGGGVVYPSWKAEYWSNPKMAGEPDRVRYENRVWFDWQDWRPVLGVHAESVRDFPTDNFSVRFTGTVIARFSEEYTIKLESDEGARLRIRPRGAEGWQTLIDAWAPHQRRTDEAGIELSAGARYDVEIDYYDLTGDAVCTLGWSSPSTPEEVVDYACGNGMKDHSWHWKADMAMAYNEQNEVDALGWPLGDCAWTINGGWPMAPGRMLLCFDGLANVSAGGATFVVGEKTFEGNLPKGEGYDPKTNRTTAYIDPTPRESDGRVVYVISFNSTQRTPDAEVGSGLTNIHLMRSREAGGTETQEPGEVIWQVARDVYRGVYVWRLQSTGFTPAVHWDQRLPGEYALLRDKSRDSKRTKYDLNYEKVILAANEMGRDLHFCFGDRMERAFMENLARLFKYGSDGVEPYDGPTKNPKYPPLNPNLRLYLEHGNEMGWSAIQPRNWDRYYHNVIRKEKKQPEWGVLNFDGAIEQDDHGGLMRYHAYRTVMMSQAMRSVWGDEMGERVRVMLNGQYIRQFQNNMYQFIDDYYNNGNGENVAEPHPVSYYLWCGGGAIYYSTTNMWAVGEEPHLENYNFEDYPAIGSGQAKMTPEGRGWTFEGTAGVADVRYPRHLAFEPESNVETAKRDKKSLLGYRFTVEARDLYAYQIGRIAYPGETGKCSLAILTEDGDSVAPTRQKQVDLGGEAINAVKPVLDALDYTGWGPVSAASRVGLYRLEAGKTYMLLSSESPGELPSARELKAGPGIAIDGPVEVVDGAFSRGKLSGEMVFKAQPGVAYPLPTLVYTDQVLALGEGLAIIPPDVNVDSAYAASGYVPDWHKSGTKAAFIAGRGKLSQTFTLAEAGDYAFIFSAACQATGEIANYASMKQTPRDNPLTITIDDQVVWENAIPGGNRKPKFAMYQYGTRYIRLEPGEHTVTIAGQNADRSATTYIYAAHIGNMIDVAGGPTAPNFLGAGTATGGTDTAFEVTCKGMAEMAQIWGLVPYCYEGGTNPGGDWNGHGVLYMHQFHKSHPLTKVAENQWAETWHRVGGSPAMFYYDPFNPMDLDAAEDYMAWQAAVERAGRWVLEPTDGIQLPATLKNENPYLLQGEPASNWQTFVPWYSEWNKPNPRGPELAKGQWKAWIVHAPKAREYNVQAQMLGQGAFVLIVDDQVLATGEAGKPLEANVWLFQGVHSLKIRCDEGAVQLGQVRVEMEVEEQR